MQLYNSLSKKIEIFSPLENNKVRMYTCGPTVYDHAHIGNLSSYIYADTLKRILIANNYDVVHVMNITDVDDKTINKSKDLYSNLEPMVALQKLTTKYEELFKKDMELVGNEIKNIDFIRATDSIVNMQVLISQLYENNFAYVADDGIYFSIESYRKSNKKYGQLINLNNDNFAKSRIINDEYDKNSAHDFALWKVAKNNEPFWDFNINNKNVKGRPGWHIECSAMSTSKLGKPFDIHTGGIDLMFPHHENEIAQSTACDKESLYAKFFVHNEHLLVNGNKMSKSLNNFLKIEDILSKGYDPLDFRLFILQSHYRKQSNFIIENLNASKNLHNKLKQWSELRYQNLSSKQLESSYIQMEKAVINGMSNDMNSSESFLAINNFIDYSDSVGYDSKTIAKTAELIDTIFGLRLLDIKDISNETKNKISLREESRRAKNWQKSDEIRNTLSNDGISIKDTPQGQVWFREY